MSRRAKLPPSFLFRQCSAGPAYPDDPSYFDPAEDNTTDVNHWMRGSRYYSIECETTWLQVTNDRAIGCAVCTMQEADRGR